LRKSRTDIVEEAGHLIKQLTVRQKQRSVQNKISISSLPLDSIVDPATDVLLTLEDGSITWLSESAPSILGYTNDEMLGTKFDAHFSPISGNGSAHDQQIGVASHSASHGWQSFDGKLKSGAVERFRVSFLGQVAGGAVGVLARIDRSAAMQLLLNDMRSRVRVIFNSIPVGLMIVTPDGKLEAVNPAMARMLERKERDFFSSTLNLVLKQDAAKQLQKVLREKPAQDYFELRELEAVMSTKEVVLVDIVGKLFQAEGQPKAILAITDATDRIQLEHLRQNLIGMVSHDLRAPLASVDSCLQLLATGKYGALTELGIERMEKARKRIASLNDMVRDLLAMARFDSGTIKLQITRFNCLDLLSESVTAITELADAKNIEVALGECEISMSGDFERLTQVVVNLLANAVHYSPPGSTIYVGARNLTSDELQIHVRDQGPGIKPEEKKFVFEKFRRLERTSASNTGGVGLGLAICKQLVELHGGTIGCDETQSFDTSIKSLAEVCNADTNHSGQNKGTVFWLRLPSSVKPIAEASDRSD
jgi:signal transduction histidine kinase